MYILETAGGLHWCEACKDTPTIQVFLRVQLCLSCNPVLMVGGCRNVTPPPPCMQITLSTCVHCNSCQLAQLGTVQQLTSSWYATTMPSDARNRVCHTSQHASCLSLSLQACSHGCRPLTGPCREVFTSFTRAIAGGLHTLISQTVLSTHQRTGTSLDQWSAGAR